MKSLKNNGINLIIRLIPLTVLLFTWSGFFGIKQYTGISYVLRNKLTCIVGASTVFVIPFLQMNVRLKYILTMLGNLIFWLPLLYGAFTKTPNITNVTVECWVSIAVILICFVLQLWMLNKEKNNLNEKEI